MPDGHVNLVLHAHLPYVYSAGEANLLEERWLFEALTESYLPLLEQLGKLQREEVPFALTLSLSPTLLAMLDNKILAGRYRVYLERLISLADSEVVRTRGDGALQPLAHFYRERFTRLLQFYTEECRCDIISVFAGLAAAGRVELITTCATHGYLPLLKTREAVQSQVRTGLDAFAARFGYYPRGMWLPECGYFPGLDEILAANQVEYIFVDTHGLQNAWPPPKHDVYAPVRTAAGVAVFARDPETSAQVWSLHSGYPGDADYREYYRDIGFELDEEYLRRFLPYPVRVNTGLKYWSVTGGDADKKVYHPLRALARAEEHAANFHYNRERQIEHLAAAGNFIPVVTAPYDAELFGHWWFEGPDFLAALFRRTAAYSGIYTFSTPSAYLDNYGSTETAELFHSSWGEGGYSKVWLNTKNDWLYPRCHEAEGCLARQAAARPHPAQNEERVLAQMGRELLLAQSSDWAFMINAGTTDEYAKMRVLSHLHNFSRLNGMLATREIVLEEVATLEKEVAGLFPDLRPQNFAPAPLCDLSSAGGMPAALMLSWEYPPLVLGGLARHVDDLSMALSRSGQPVSVLTSRAKDTAEYENRHNIGVYRVAPYQEAGEELEFHDWVMQLNLMFFNLAQQIIPADRFAILHAHDWLVGAAALKMKRYWRLPLVATIHATEYGRNGGLYTQLQKRIHAHEQELVDGADHIICCSEYMAREVVRLFSVHPQKITVIQNGVMPEKVAAKPLSGAERRKYAADDEDILYFVGRLVREKGVEVLLRALPSVFAAFPRCRAVISGKGPMLAALQQQARDLGIERQVHFTGFVSDEERNRLLASAAVTVLPSLYEPFGIVALEAMAASAAVVVSDVGGMGEVVRHGVDGFKCPPGNHSALSATIRTLMGDPALRSRLAKRARERVVQAYSWSELAQLTKDVYRNVWEGALPALTEKQGGIN